MDDPAVKQRFEDALNSLSVECKGIATNHHESLTPRGVIEIWDALKISDLKVVSAG
jgi:hypothetical protein